MPTPWTILRVLSCRHVDVPNVELPSDLDQWLEAESHRRPQRKSGRDANSVWPAPTTPPILNPLLKHLSPFSSCGPMRWNTINPPEAAEITDLTLRPSRDALFEQAATSPPVQKIRLLITIPRLIMTIGLPIVDPNGISTLAVLTRLHEWLLEPVDQAQWSKFTQRGEQAVMKQHRLNRRMVGTRLPLNEVVNLDCMDGRHFFRGLDMKSGIAISEGALAEWERDEWENEGWPAYNTQVYFVLLEQTPYG